MMSLKSVECILQWSRTVQMSAVSSLSHQRQSNPVPMLVDRQLEQSLPISSQPYSVTVTRGSICASRQTYAAVVFL